MTQVLQVLENCTLVPTPAIGMNCHGLGKEVLLGDMGRGKNSQQI